MKIQLNRKAIIIGATILFIVAILVVWLVIRSTSGDKVENDDDTTTQENITENDLDGSLPTSTSVGTTSGTASDTTLESEASSEEGNAMPVDFTDEPTEGEMLLRAQLPIMTQYFYMEYKQDTGRYLVTLYIDPLNTDAGTVDEQLAYTQGQAEAWISDFGVEPAKLPIDYTDAR